MTSQISIPYGAIKRTKSQNKPLMKQKFQFLMVRLKAIFNCLCYSFIFISIPYGAIKSI